MRGRVLLIAEISGCLVGKCCSNVLAASDSEGGMIPISDSEKRLAFSIWLRTGRLPRVALADGVEVKFNPWHDPADGRFTFAGSGQNYGQSGSGGFRGGGGGSFGGGGASSHEAWPRSSGPDGNRQRLRPIPNPNARPSGPPPRPSTPRASGKPPPSQNGWDGGGFTGGGGGDTGGGRSFIHRALGR